MNHYRLTTPQSNIWNLQKAYPDTAVSNICGGILFREKRDSEGLKRAIRIIVQSQSALQLRFQEGKTPTQYIAEIAREDIPVFDFSTMPEFNRYAEKFARKPIELTGDSMFRAAVVHVEGRSGVLLCMSHLIADAWTFGLLAKQLDETYRGFEKDSNFVLSQADYADFIRSEEDYLTSMRYQRDKAYWDGKYGVSGNNTVFVKSVVKLAPASVASIAAKRVARELPLRLEQKITVFCERHSVTQAVLFETAMVIYLAKINPENQLVTIGIPVLNRSSIKEKRTAGMFISTMPLTVKTECDISIGALAERIAKAHIELFRHQRYPYADILKLLRKEQNFSGNLYDVMVSCQNAETETDADTKWYSNGYSEIPLAVHIDNRDGRESHTLTVDYQTEIFGEEEAQYLIKRLEYILKQITESADKMIRDISIVPDEEYRKIIEEFNDTAVDYPRDKCVHELFEEQARRTPDGIALVFQEKRFTYREADEMSSSLAHFLREKGVGRGDVVPIIARRSWHIVAAMLGILKAGAAYMPVSPDYPADRTASMLDTAKCKIALLYGYEDLEGRNTLDASGVECVELEGFDFSGDITPPENANKPGDLCYVIFTSGSTGTPKGVSVSHRNVGNYCNNNNNNNVCSRIIKDGYRSIVSVTNIVFDIFVTETLLPLLNGLTIYFADDEEAMRQDRFAELVSKNKIEVMQTTPTRMRSYMLDKEKCGYLGTLKAIVLGGEAFPADLYTELKKYTAADIFNIYGPAETTVWSTNAEITQGLTGRPHQPTSPSAAPSPTLRYTSWTVTAILSPSAWQGSSASPVTAWGLDT